MSQVHPMLEKVARAMALEDGLDPDEHIIGGQASGFQDYGPLWQAEQASQGQLGMTDYVRQARAAVRALMEPTPDMVKAGDGDETYVGKYEQSPELVFRAMLLPLVEGEEG